MTKDVVGVRPFGLVDTLLLACGHEVKRLRKKGEIPRRAHCKICGNPKL